MIIYIILFLIIITLLLLSLIGFIVKPTNIPINVNPGTGISNKKCTSQIVECSTDSDCSSNCVESSQGEQMKCIELKVNNKDYGNTKKVCALAKAEMKCNTQYGGLPVWSGWTNPDRMEWDCLCMYPNYAGGESCSKINPNICNGGKGFEWNANDGPPEKTGICTCVDGQEKIIDENGIPICVEKGKGLWYKDSKPNHVVNMCNEEHCKLPNCILTKDPNNPELNLCACLGNDGNNVNTGWQDGIDQMCVECKPGRGPPGDCSKKLFTDKPITINSACLWGGNIGWDHQDQYCKNTFGQNSYVDHNKKCDTDNCPKGADQFRYGCVVPKYYANLDFIPDTWENSRCNNPGDIIGPDNPILPPGFVKVDN